MKHTLIAEPTGAGLFNIYYLTDNAAQTPVIIASDISQKWAERFATAYNSQADLLKALEACADYLGDTYQGPIEQAWAAIALATSPTNREDTTP